MINIELTLLAIFAITIVLPQPLYPNRPININSKIKIQSLFKPVFINFFFHSVSNLKYKNL